jgi:hypothetical protein
MSLKAKPVPRKNQDAMKGMSVKSGDKRSTAAGAGMTKQGVAKYNRRTGGKLKLLLQRRNLLEKEQQEESLIVLGVQDK